MSGNQQCHCVHLQGFEILDLKVAVDVMWKLLEISLQT